LVQGGGQRTQLVRLTGMMIVDSDILYVTGYGQTDGIPFWALAAATRPRSTSDRIISSSSDGVAKLGEAIRPRPSHLGGSHGTRRRCRKNPSVDAKEPAGGD